MNVSLLLDIMSRERYDITTVATALGVSRQCLYKKIDGSSEFKVSEINALSKLLKLNAKERQQIFFADCVAKKDNK